MSVHKITYLRCDAGGCAVTFRSKAVAQVDQVRRAARVVGWSHRSGHPTEIPGTPAAGGDFCPDHTPDGA